MTIHNIIASVYYNKWFKRLDFQLNETANPNSKKVPKVAKPINKKSLGTSVMNEQPNVPSLPGVSVCSSGCPTEFSLNICPLKSFDSV